MRLVAFHRPLAFVNRRSLGPASAAILTHPHPIFATRPLTLISKRMLKTHAGRVGLTLKASLTLPVLTSAITTLAYQSSFFIISSIFRTDKLTDVAGVSNIALLALISFFTSPLQTIRHSAVVACITTWAARLGIFLFRRIRRWGVDRRLDPFRNNLAARAGFWSFQACWVWACALPATLLTFASPGPALGLQDAFGAAVFVFSLAFEAVADAQKEKAKINGWPGTGLWKYSRHPNYFGEILVWWGIYTMAVPDLGSSAVFALTSPLFVTGLLLFLSGVPLLESSADQRFGHREDYRRYKQETSVLLPLPPTWYAPLPRPIKKWMLLDLPMYNTGISANGSVEES